MSDFLSGDFESGVKFKKQFKNEQLNMKIKDINNELSVEVNYEGSLYRRDNSRLDENKTISFYLSLFGTETFDFRRSIEIEITIIPNGHWISEYTGLTIKSMKLKTYTTLKELNYKIVREYSMKSVWAQLYNYKMPLYMIESTQQFTLEQLNIKNGDNIFVDFFPISIYKTRYAYIDNSDDIFKNNDCWNMPVQQTVFSQSTFLAVLKVLDLNLYGSDVHRYYFFHFLATVIPYNPAVNCLYATYSRSRVMTFEPYVIAKTMFYLMKSILDGKKDDSQVFFYFPQFMFYALKKTREIIEELQFGIYSADSKLMSPYLIEWCIADDTCFENVWFTFDYSLNQITDCSHNISKAFDVNCLHQTILLFDLEEKKNEVRFLKTFLHGTTWNQMVFEKCKTDFILPEILESMPNDSDFSFLTFRSREEVRSQSLKNCLVLLSHDNYIRSIVLVNKIENDATFKIFDPLKMETPLTLSNLISLMVMKVFHLRYVPIKQINVIAISCGNDSNEVLLMKQLAELILKELTEYYGSASAIGILKFGPQLEVVHSITQNHGILKFDSITKTDESACITTGIYKGLTMIYKFAKHEENKKFIDKTTQKRILLITSDNELYKSSIEDARISEELRITNTVLDVIPIIKNISPKLRLISNVSFNSKGVCIPYYYNQEAEADNSVSKVAICDYKQLESVLIKEEFLDLETRFHAMDAHLFQTADTNLFTSDILEQFLLYVRSSKKTPHPQSLSVINSNNLFYELRTRGQQKLRSVFQVKDKAEQRCINETLVV